MEITSRAQIKKITTNIDSHHLIAGCLMLFKITAAVLALSKSKQVEEREREANSIRQEQAFKNKCIQGQN